MKLASRVTVSMVFVILIVFLGIGPRDSQSVPNCGEENVELCTILGCYGVDEPCSAYYCDDGAWYFCFKSNY